MNLNQERLVTESKLVMLRRLAYYGTYVIGIPLIESESIPTACTDGTMIMFNPTWLLHEGDKVKPLRPRDQVIFVLAHEVMHICLKHGLRMGFRDPSLWNVACDFAINLLLHKGKVGVMPPAEINPKTGEKYPILLDMKYDGMSAEAIYDLLEKEHKKQGGSGKLQLGDVVIDLSQSDPGGTGGFKKPTAEDGSELSANKTQEIERDIDSKTSAALAAAKAIGQMPRELELLLKTSLKPIIDWRDRLRQFVFRQIPNDYSWSRPSRRHLSHDLYLPHIEKSGVGKILVIMDTSGSVNYSSPESEGAQYYSEIKAIHEDVMPETLHIMYCDSKVAGHDTFQSGEEPILNPRGGGGTDFRPPFKMVDEIGVDIQCAIYLTDGHGPFPSQPPSYPVLWVITSDVVAPWGETVPLRK